MLATEDSKQAFAGCFVLRNAVCASRFGGPLRHAG